MALFENILNRKLVRQRFVYLNCTKDFVQTNILDFLLSQGNKLKENIVQDHTSIRIMAFYEVYIKLNHCFIFP